MKDQFITLIQIAGSDLRLVTISLNHVVTLESISDEITQITLIDGRIISSPHPLSELHPLIADKSRIVPEANQRMADLIKNTTDLFPTGPKNR